MSDNTAPAAQAAHPVAEGDDSASSAHRSETATPFVADPVLASPPVPTPSAHAAPSPAVHTGITVDERAYEQYQALAKTVLESAEIASRSAEAALSVSREMRHATGQFKELSDGGYKKARLLLAIGGGVMVVCVLFFLIMGVRLVSRINQLDVMMEAVGKRVIDLNAGMESLEGINKNVQELAQKQAELTKAQNQIEGRIDAQLKQSENLVQKVPSETAKQVAASSDTLKKEVQSLSGRLQTQANAVQNLGNEVKALKGSVGNVDGLKRDVEALVTLQRERYLEALQKNNASAAKERALQYPRVQPKGSDSGTTSTAPPSPAAGPVVSTPVKP